MHHFFKANVLVGANCEARLCDFGLARLHEDSGFGRLETSTAFKGSIRWCSPELLNGEPRAPTSDVYAWAWLAWEVRISFSYPLCSKVTEPQILTGKLPYEESSVDFVIIRRILESPLPQVDGRAHLKECLPVWDLMTRCWNGNPQQRPTARMCKTTITCLVSLVDYPYRSVSVDNTSNLTS